MQASYRLPFSSDPLDLPHQKNVGSGSNQRHGRNGDQRPREIVPLDKETNGQWDYDGGQIADEIEDAAGQADQALRGYRRNQRPGNGPEAAAEEGNGEAGADGKRVAHIIG